MGKNTNQLITQQELYNLGYTSSLKDSQLVTNYDLQSYGGFAPDQTPVVNYKFTSLVGGSTSAELGFYLSSTSAAWRFPIFEIELPTPSSSMQVTFTGAHYIDLYDSNYSTIYYWYEIYDSDVSVPQNGGGITYNNGIWPERSSEYTYTVTEEGDDQMIGTSTSLSIIPSTASKVTVYLAIRQSDSNHRVYTIRDATYNLGISPRLKNWYKCVKYSDVPRAPGRHITVKISESVGGKTRANQIKIYYVWKTSSGATEQTELVGNWDYGDNIDGSASKVISVSAPPLNHLNQYSTEMRIWCGTTNSNQTWKYKLNGDSSWRSLSSSAKSVNLNLNSATWPSGTSSVSTYHGAFAQITSIEFNVS